MNIARATDTQSADVAPKPKFYRSGTRIFPCSDEYFTALDRARPLAKVARAPVYEGAALKARAESRDDIGFMDFLGKWYEAALVRDALRMAGFDRTFSRMLDIGSGPALQPRMLRSAGCVGQVIAQDIYDGSGRCSEAMFRRYAAAAAALYTGFRARWVVPRRLRRRVQFLARLESKLPLGVETFGHWPDERLLNRVRVRRKSLDGYHVGEIFEIDGRFDLITSFMAIEYVSFDRLAAKVSALLAPGGVFAFVVSYWWYPVNNTLLYGRFPYLTQQLSTDDALAYFAEMHPDLPQDTLARRLSYSDLVRRTVADYESAAAAHGLLPRLALRLAPTADDNPRAIIGPRGIDRLPGWSLAAVLEGARRLNPLVSFADLMTSHILLVCERR